MSLAQTIPWEQYQQLAPDQRRRPLTDAEYAALTPQQRVALGLDENEQGAPADFNGPVFPNPTHIQPRLDTDPAIDHTRLPEGVTFQHGNFSGTPQMDVSNPAAADVQPAMGREVGAKMSAAPIKLPPGASLESAPDTQGMKLPQGATLEGAPPAQSGQPAKQASGEQAEPPSFWDTIKREGKSMTGTIAGMPAAVYHAFSEPATEEETKKFGGEEEVTGPKRIGLGLHRLVTAPVENAADWYGQAAKGEIPNAYEQALSVAPEAVGSAAGNVVGAKLAEMGVNKLMNTSASAATAPVRAGVRLINKGLEKAPGTIGGTVGAALGAKLGGPMGAEMGGIAGAVAGKELLPQVRIPGEGFGLPNRVVGGPEVAPQFEAPGAAASMARSGAATKPTVTPAQVESSLNDALGGQKLQPGVSLRNQPAAMAAARGKLPEGFTPVDSSVLKGYKYDPDAQEFTAITQNGQSYTHGEVTPDQVAAFEKSPSQGKAWTSEIRNNNVLVKKNGMPVRPGVKPEPTETAPASPDLTQQLQDSLDAARSKKASVGANARGQQPSVDVNSVFNRLVKGEAGQAGLPGAVTNFDEGIADIQKQPVISQKTGQVPASGFLNKVGADRASILKTPQDAQSVFYHRQQIAQNGPPNVELHLDEGGNVIGADGRHRALAAIEHGGANAKVNVTIYKHPYQSAPE